MIKIKGRQLKKNELKILMAVQARKITLEAGKAYIRSQRNRGYKDHTREEITSAWLMADNLFKKELKKLKGDT